MARVALVLAHLALAISSSAAFETDANSWCSGNPPNLWCFSWQIANGNVTFTASSTVYRQITNATRVQYVGLALGTFACGSMWPAYVWLAMARADGSVVVEDRRAIGHSAPPCLPSQLSHTLSGAVNASGAISVTWTRPLVPPPAYVLDGHPSITAGAPVLLNMATAYNNTLARPCETDGLAFHDEFASTSANLGAAAGKDVILAALGPAADAAPATDAAPYAGLFGMLNMCFGCSFPALTHINGSSGISTPLDNRRGLCAHTCAITPASPLTTSRLRPSFAAAIPPKTTASTCSGRGKWPGLLYGTRGLQQQPLLRRPK